MIRLLGFSLIISNSLWYVSTIKLESQKEYISGILDLTISNQNQCMFQLKDYNKRHQKHLKTLNRQGLQLASHVRIFRSRNYTPKQINSLMAQRYKKFPKSQIPMIPFKHESRIGLQGF